MARIVYMGTAEFAVPPMEALIREHEVIGVVTRPDAPAGRGRRRLAPPVKEAALSHGLPLYQPRTLRDPEAIARIERWDPEVIVVAAIGFLLPPAILGLPPRGCLNIHPSLLPKYRGAAPVVAAILAGEEETGVTVMLMDEGMDTGPILAQRKAPIGSEDTRASLEGRLAQAGAALILETLPAWLAGELHPRPQSEEGACLAPPLRKALGRIDWNLSAMEIWRRVRAYHPWPGAYSTWQGKQLKVIRAEAWEGWSGDVPPGQVVSTSRGVGVATGAGILLLREVQLAGRRAMPIDAFLRGQRSFLGSRLGG